ncbi:MAG: glycoside hydrolase family 125 protein, partial [Tumebacillaceae bacterium]
VDVGCGLLSASIGPDGLVRSVNRYHPGVGFVTLHPIEQFPNDKWYDSEFVRRYRRRLVDGDEGFGIRVREQAVEQEVFFVGSSAPLFRFRWEAFEVRSLFAAVEEEGVTHLIHRYEVTNVSDGNATFPYEIGGTFSVGRCSYGQLTEGGPIPVPPLENALEVLGNRLSIVNAHLPARADVYLFDGAEPMPISPARKCANRPVRYQHEAELNLAPGESRTLRAVYVLSPWVEEKAGCAPASVEELTKKAMRQLIRWRTNKNEIKAERFLVERNIDYILSCCSIPISDEHVCIITDHQLLPLSWNRDAYYMMQLLLTSVQKANLLFEQADQSQWKERVQSIVRGHLLWMFETAERPQQYFGRAYVTHGSCKDEVFQLDQQCYPLLELCEYHAMFQDRETVERVLPQVRELLAVIMKFRDEEKWLFRTGETPADDKVDLPYHFSSQVLVWHTLQQLTALHERIAFLDADLLEAADRVRRDCLDAFVSDQLGEERFAYLTDLQGNYQFYHDANDLPTVYAPIWGFCRTDDATWRATMEFAFREENRGGFYAGTFGGLGSVHTPHPWPLGDAQELLLAKQTGEAARYDRVLRKILQVVQWDGLFSEAVHEESGKVESRHWFSWPGAFISTVLMLAWEE